MIPYKWNLCELSPSESSRMPRRLKTNFYPRLFLVVVLNLLVVVGVTRRREMRTTRNIFILQLSLADLLLVLTLPFTLTDVLHRKPDTFKKFQKDNCKIENPFKTAKVDIWGCIKCPPPPPTYSFTVRSFLCPRLLRA